MKRVGIIMAGGSGERFWPLSRRNKPKQLLNLVSEDKMMIEESIERISPVIPAEDIFIITGAHLQKPIRQALPQLPPENVIAEPHKRNTAPCLALGAAFLRAKYNSQGFSDEQISIAVLTADQDINPASGFVKTVNAALNYVEKNPVIVTIGIKPNRPETGYGYIEVESAFEDNSDIIEINPVLNFKEKPDQQKAEEYIESGRFLWNSGMFFYRLDTFINEMSKHLPAVGEKILPISVKYTGKTDDNITGPFADVSDDFFNFPDISIDFGLMEKTDKIVVVKAAFDWDDIGAWDSLERVMKKDNSNNISFGKTLIKDSSGSIIFNSKDKNTVVAALGLKGMVVVVTDDAVLVCPKDKVQDVKKAVEELKKNKEDKWL